MNGIWYNKIFWDVAGVFDRIFTEKLKKNCKNSY